MRWCLALLVCTVAGAGCTSLALERHTLAQGISAEELRYREVLEAVAMVADNPATLPTYASVYAGTAQVTDSAQATSSTVWSAVGFMSSKTRGFFSETASPLVSRNIVQNWSLDPIVVPEKLEAIRCACQWVLFGPERISGSCIGVLASPEQAPYPGRHFGVADSLARLPRTWVHVGCLADVPAGAVYKAHSGHTWVWVCRDGLDGLADFSLIIESIARINSNSPTLFVPAVVPSGFRVVTQVLEEPNGSERAVSALVYLDEAHQLVPATPYFPWRVDNVGAESHLSSKINAAGGP